MLSTLRKKTHKNKCSFLIGNSLQSQTKKAITSDYYSSVIPFLQQMKTTP